MVIVWRQGAKVVQCKAGAFSEAAFIWHLGVLLSGSQLSDISLNKFVLVVVLEAISVSAVEEFQVTQLTY